MESLKKLAVRKILENMPSYRKTIRDIPLDCKHLIRETLHGTLLDFVAILHRRDIDIFKAPSIRLPSGATITIEEKEFRWYNEYWAFHDGRTEVWIFRNAKTLEKMRFSYKKYEVSISRSNLTWTFPIPKNIENPHLDITPGRDMDIVEGNRKGIYLNIAKRSIVK